LRKAIISYIMSVCKSAWNNSASTERIVIKFGILVFFENLSRNYKFHLNLTRITGTLLEDLCTFMIVSCWILVRTRIVADKGCTENQNPRHLWHKVQKCCTARQVIDDSKATNTHSQNI